MKILRNVFVVALLSSTMCFANAVHGVFNLNGGQKTIPPVGTVNFTLQSNGTIFASVTFTRPGRGIKNFGFGPATKNLPQSNFTHPGTILNTSGWTSLFGTLAGFQANGSQTSYNFIIGTPGQFTSVYNVLGGNTPVNFFLIDNHNDVYEAKAVPNVPEPNTLALLASGGLGLIGVIRRRLA